jgi:hypothetical protein
MARRTPHEPVLTATLLAPVVVWLAAYFGFDMDEAAATQIAGVVLLVGSLFARQRVRPLSKGPGPSAAGLLGRRARSTPPTD